MTDDVEANEAKTRFAALLNMVEAGEVVVITRQGRPVARLEPVTPKRADVGCVIDQLCLLRLGRALGGFSVSELIEEGRRL